MNSDDFALLSLLWTNPLAFTTHFNHEDALRVVSLPSPIFWPKSHDEFRELCPCYSIFSNKQLFSVQAMRYL